MINDINEYKSLITANDQWVIDTKTFVAYRLLIDDIHYSLMSLIIH